MKFSENPGSWTENPKLKEIPGFPNGEGPRRGGLVIKILRLFEQEY